MSRNASWAFGNMTFRGWNEGYYSPNASLVELANQGDIEVTITKKEAWYVARCVVANITRDGATGGSNINMRLPCFRGAIQRTHPVNNASHTIENVREWLLPTSASSSSPEAPEGSFYADRSEGKVYYKARAIDRDMARA